MISSKFFFFFILTSLFFQVSYGQWERFYDSVPNINSMSFSSAEFGMAACRGKLNGVGGSVNLTKNGGEIWEESIGIDSVTFEDMVSLDSITFIAVGKYRSINGGATYNKGIIVRTGDRGKSWDTTWLPYHLVTIEKINDSSLIIIGKERVNSLDNSRIILSRNNGETWNEDTLNKFDNVYLRDVSFVNDSLGFLARINYRNTSGEVFRTIDGGNSYDTVFIDTNNSGSYGGISFISDSVGYAIVGEILYKTLDQGSSWDSIGGFNVSNNKSLIFLNDTVGYSMSCSEVSKTIDGGKTWHSWRLGYCFLGHIMAISVLSEDTVLIGGEYKFYRTFNGGDSVLTVNLFEENDPSLNIKYFPNPVKEQLNILTKEEFEFKLFNLKGQQIKQKFEKQNNGYKSYVRDLKSGVYFLILSSDKFNKRIKFIKE